MQSNYKHVYKMTSDRTGELEELYKDLGNFVFAELNSMLKRPKSLIVKLRGVGWWYLRRKRLFGIFNMYPLDYGKTKEDFSNDLAFLKYENKKEVYELFKDRLADYEEYVKIRSEIRKKRNETQSIIQPPDRKEQS